MVIFWNFHFWEKTQNIFKFHGVSNLVRGNMLLKIISQKFAKFIFLKFRWDSLAAEMWRAKGKGFQFPFVFDNKVTSIARSKNFIHKNTSFYFKIYKFSTNFSSAHETFFLSSLNSMDF